MPIIDVNPRGNKKRKHELKAENRRFEFVNIKNPVDTLYNERSNVERVNGCLIVSLELALKVFYVKSRIKSVSKEQSHRLKLLICFAFAAAISSGSR